MSGRPGPDRDELTVARLTGAARRHAPAREPTDAETAAAVAELRAIAGGRGDLLAEVAGLITGFYAGTAEERKAQTAARYCRAAGADPDLMAPWIAEGKRRATSVRRASLPVVSDRTQRVRRGRGVLFHPPGGGPHDVLPLEFVRLSGDSQPALVKLGGDERLMIVDMFLELFPAGHEDRPLPGHQR